MAKPEFVPSNEGVVSGQPAVARGCREGKGGGRVTPRALTGSLLRLRVRIGAIALAGSLLVMPLRIANIVIAAALCSCSLRIKLERCFSTVLGLTPSSRAINLLELPSAMRVRTSRSRPVIDCVAEGEEARCSPETWPER